MIIPSQERETRELERLEPEELLRQVPPPPEIPESPSPRRPPLLRRSNLWKLGVVLLVLAVGVYVWSRPAGTQSSGTVAPVIQGPLAITVLEKGTVEALESQLIKSEVRGQTKILDIVDEGYIVTEEDVKNKKVLVQLDDSELVEDLTEQQMRYASSLSTFTDAQSRYEVQLKQNESDITTAELAVKFARIDFEKYLGADLGKATLEKFEFTEPEPTITVENIEVTPAPQGTITDAVQEAAVKTEGGAEPESAVKAAGGAVREATVRAEGGSEAPPSMPPPRGVAQADSVAGSPGDITELRDQTDAAVEAARKQLDAVKFASLIGDSRLGGDAMQMQQDLDAKIKLAEEQLKNTETKLEGTEKLAEKNFVTPLELEEVRMALSRNEIELASAKRDLDLFRAYEFPKQAEKFLSDYAEAWRKLSRAKTEALSKLVQARAQLDSTAAQFKLQTDRLQERKDRIAKCRIVAERPGIVIYAGSGNMWQRQGPIEKGASVNEQQEILSIPDMTQMGVEVKIHESSIGKVRKGQKAKVRITGSSERELEGEVVRVSLLPDNQQRWLNPDVKLYSCRISVNGEQEWLQRQIGKTAQAEILITNLENVKYVPIQAVTDSKGERVSYVERGAGLAPERRVVQTGEFNDKYIEVKEGLKAGERVLLRAPEASPSPDGADADGEKAAEAKPDGGNGGHPERPAGPPPAQNGGGAPRGA